jgi:hypothetical protein
MRAMIGLAGVLGLALLPLLGSDRPAPKADSAVRIEQLIEQLGSSDFQVREAAQRQLEDIGPGALPALRVAQSRPDAEVRRRLDELIPRLHTAEILAPKRVTLQPKPRPIRETLAEIAKQTGYKLTLWPDAPANGEREKQVYSFDFQDLTFWEALDKLCEEAGLQLEPNHGDDTLRLRFQDQFVPFVYREGPFRIVAQGFNYNRSIQFGSLPRTPSPGGEQGSEQLNCNLNIIVEPKMPLLGIGEIKLLAAFDDQNHSLLAGGNRAINASGPRSYRYGGYRSYSQQVHVSLVWGAKTARTVRLLKGSMPVTLLAEQKPLIVVDKILAAQGRKLQQGTAHLDVEEVKEDGNAAGGKTYQLKLSLRETRKDSPNDYSWVNSLYQRIELHDAKGGKYASRGMHWLNSTPTSVQGTFIFGDPGNNAQLGPPTQLIYYAWVTLDHEVAFEFRNLPLP